MWFLLQSSIMFAVMASNIHWNWTPNGYLAGLIGVALAYGATRLCQLGQSWIGSRKP
jgi:hypothetical protein